MIIDVHTHIFPEDICSNRQAFFDGEPEFRLLYDSPGSKLVGASDLILSMDENGVEKSVVFGFPWNGFDKVNAHNDYIIEMVRAYPDRLIGFCCVNPCHGLAESEVARCIGEGLKGVGELAFYKTRMDEGVTACLSPVMDLCRKSGLPVMIHTNEPIGHAYPGKAPMTLSEIYGLATHFPDNKIILAHWGGGLFFYNLLKKQVRNALKNVYVDTAASPFLYRHEIYRVATIAFGAEKILFGSDYPLLKASRYFDEMKNSGISDDDTRLICGENAAKLFNV